MADKLTIQDLSTALAEKNGIDRKDAETFIRAMFDLIEESLEKDKYVKVKGFGVFKLISVNNRESVNINTGERFEIQEHYKVSFIPDPTLKGIINKPFEFFDSVVLNEGIELENTEEVADIKTPEGEGREETEPSSENLECEQSDEFSETEPGKNEAVTDTDAHVGKVVEFSSSENFYTDEVTGGSVENADSSEASAMIEMAEEVDEVTEHPGDEVNERADYMAEQTEEIADEKADGAAESAEEEDKSIIEVDEPTVEENAEQADEATDTIGEKTKSDQEPSEESDGDATAEPIVAGEAKQEDMKPVSNNKKTKDKEKGSKGWLVAACLVIVLGIGAYAFYALRGEKEGVTAAATQPQKSTSEANAGATSPPIAETNETQPIEERTAASTDEMVATTTNVETTKSSQTAQKTEPAPAKAAQQTAKKTEPTAANATVATKSAADQTPKISKVKYSIVGLKCEHKVVSGETLRKIALKYYGTKELSPYIVEYNNIKQPDKVAVGVVLKIPELKENE